MTTKSSSRFDGSFLTEKVVPVLLGLILLGLLAVLVVVGLNSLGVLG